MKKKKCNFVAKMWFAVETMAPSRVLFAQTRGQVDIFEEELEI